MKLISLYIENFGGLSGYALNFSDGLTVIQAENGFGKTTLAEFIRAMLYGFPRKTKTLDKDKRKKYLPWNGGKCGGNLIFEWEGKQYRLERTFGAAPKADTFKLIDLATNKKSDRFSENIGLELFGLDADSFERSTYMPQLHDSGVLTTDSIQAKLGDLVEDTGDINNFDKAVAALKAKRIGYQLYRGSGGTVAEAGEQVTRLQKELDQAEGQRGALEDSCAEVQRLERELEEANTRIAAVREEITRASEAQAVAAVWKQRDDLKARYDAAAARQAQIAQQYTAGLPAEPELDELDALADRAAALAGMETATQADRDTEVFLEENRDRFLDKIPTPERLGRCRTEIADYRALMTEARSTGLSDIEKKTYQKLLPIFESGALDEETLNDLARQNRELVKQRHCLESLAPDKEELARQEALEQFFGGTIPGEDAICAQRQALAEIQKLRQENLQLAALREPLPQPRQAGWLWPVLAAAAGLVGIAAGVVLLVKQIYVYGGIALGAGVLALTAAIFLSLRRMVSRELSGVERYGLAPQTQEKIRENEERINALEMEVQGFVCRYSREENLTEGLSRIQRNREELLELREKQARQEEKRAALAEEISAMEAALKKSLQPFFTSVTDFEQAIVDVQLLRGQFLNLQAEKAASDEKIAALTARAAELRQEITAFLGQYYDAVADNQLEELLARLQRDSDAYVQAGVRHAQWQERRERHEQEVKECREALIERLARWALVPDPDIRGQLRQLRSDREDLAALDIQKEKLATDQAEFEQAHSRELAAKLPDAQADLDELKDREAGLAAQITALTRQALEQRQRSVNLRAQVDQIPELWDELESWQEKRNAGLQKARTLDDTVEFLQKSKESLSLSYMGPIRSSFASYLRRLSGEGAEQILVSPDLNVQLERHGEARELAYFSAGQTDTVMLCMRLALVDALFREAKPFVILDDPFVNLDDRRTAEALALLRELAKERQIVYLVCNSSRNY